MKKLIVGNWKMNGTIQDSKALIAEIINSIYENRSVLHRCDFVICPSYLHISAVRHATITTDYIDFGAQDCSIDDNGAHTGDISAEMLKDARCKYVILGHSERRHGRGETDEIVTKKAEKAHQAGLVSIICVGETLQEREKGAEQEVVLRQIQASLPASATPDNTIIAYEPVWAIGTGKNASTKDIQSMHGFIREKLKERLARSENLRILYGGSMKPENASIILATPNVDGGLIGGSSLKANDFINIALCAVNV